METHQQKLVKERNVLGIWVVFRITQWAWINDKSIKNVNVWIRKQKIPNTADKYIDIGNYHDEASSGLFFFTDL